MIIVSVNQQTNVSISLCVECSIVMSYCQCPCVYNGIVLLPILLYVETSDDIRVPLGVKKHLISFIKWSYLENVIPTMDSNIYARSKKIYLLSLKFGLNT